MLAPMPVEQMPKIHRLIPSRLLKEPNLATSIKALEEETRAAYNFSLRKGIG